MSQAAYLRDMFEDPEPDLPVGPSEVASFYTEQNILITGGTGFLGKLVIERILRSCPTLNTMFLLVRAKKEKNPEDRFNEIFDDLIFCRLKKEKPYFLRKVVLIKGDVAAVGLGLSTEDREILRSTNIVINGAATVRFNEKLRIAASINVRGTEELLLLAEEMVDLKAFVHISTAYSNCVSNVIKEKFYPPPIDSEQLLSLLDILDDSSLDRLTPVLMGKWPNTYVFTKAIGEDVLRRKSQNFPLCIVRPSIVIATSKEPIAGWINNLYGATGILAGAGIGLLRTLHCDGNLVADIIPADYVVNTVIAAAWDVATAQNLNVNSELSNEIREPLIFNVVSSCQTPITWQQLTEHCERYVNDIPSMRCLWYYCFKLNKNLWVHKLSMIFLHLIPAAVVDSLARCTGQKPRLWDTYKKIHKSSSIIEYFTLHEWKFSDDNVQRLWQKMGPTDRNEFDLDIGSLNWEDYSYGHARGIRNFILKDPLDTVPQGLVKYAKLRVAHYTLVTAVCCFLVWLIWTGLRLSGFL